MIKREFILVVGILVLSSCLASAGVGEWFKGITGRATTGEANATVTLAGTSPVSILIWNNTLTSKNPVEDTSLAITFVVSITDPDGAADVNQSSVAINVTRTGEATKTNSSCFVGPQTTTTRNFTCGFDIWYFEQSGTWNITARANDYGNGTYIQNVTNFYYGSSSSIKVGPMSLTWPGVSPGQTNQTSNNDPLLVNNTGNYPITNLTIIGINLVGANPSYFIDARNFTVDTETGGTCTGGDCTECGVSVATSGVMMQNNTELQIFLANVSRGNHSANNGYTGQEQLYFCMYNVPSNILSQAYTTPDEWTFTLRT